MKTDIPRSLHLKDYKKPDYRIDTVDLTFEILDEYTKVTSILAVEFNHDDECQLPPLVLDGVELELISVEIDKKELESNQYQLEQEYLTLYPENRSFKVKTIVKINPKTNTALSGLYLSDGAYCTQCEAEGFRRITYFLDRPDVLAKYRVKIEADQSLPFLLSNGNRIDAGELPEQRHFAQWEDPFPKPSYLFALVAGDFDRLEDQFTTVSGRPVKLELFVDKGNLNKAKYAMESLKNAMKWDEQRFGLEYDLDIYMVVAVDFFNMGAMENKGLNIFNTKFVLADKASATDMDYHGIESVIGHEYFHNWTGNRVTCRDWFQLSLKEGLTVFRDQEFSSDLGSRAVNRIDAIKIMKNQQFAEDASPMAHPIRPQAVIEMNNFYTVTVYDKGAEVIRMMHTLLGEVGFQKGMKLYFERHDGQAVTCDDFVSAMQDASGIDLSQFRRWYEQAGTPIVTVKDHYDPKLQQYSLTISQANPTAGEDAQPLHIPFDIELIDEQGNSVLTQVLDVKQATETFLFNNIDCAVIPSLLQNFSAPVRLKYDFTIAQLVHLMRYASSEVARWEASVELVSQAIWHNLARHNANKVMQLDEQVILAFVEILQNTKLDPALVAEIMTIPSTQTLIEQVGQVDLDALLPARKFVQRELANHCHNQLLTRYQQLLDIDTAEARALKNATLLWLAISDQQHEELVISQFSNANNMTDSLAALIAANQANLPCRDQLMAQFEQKWQATPLVMDKWFALQATQDTDNVIEKINLLRSHPAFSIQNPNRVRSLMGSFIMGNIPQFHKKDGSGYDFLTKLLFELNTVNPQVAARVMTPLIQFAKFDPERQRMMKASLKQLQSLPNLAKDLYEKVDRALNTI